MGTKIIKMRTRATSADKWSGKKTTNNSLIDKMLDAVILKSSGMSVEDSTCDIGFSAKTRASLNRKRESRPKTDSHRNR